MSPLILTLTLDTAAQEYFNRLRHLHFPPERNFLKAHLTLFHHLPAGEAGIEDTIRAICTQQSPMRLHVSSIVGMGNGVAFKISCDPLLELHAFLQQQWMPWLKPQDRHKLWPHVTIQNKVAPIIAKALQQELAQSFVPFEAWGIGLSLWEYLGGPWKHLQDFAFVGVEKLQSGATA